MWNPFRKKTKTENTPADDNWESLWNERLQGLESLYGPSADTVGHAFMPFELGGTADVVYFNYGEGRLAVTAELTGSTGQQPSTLGHYELAIAHRDPDEQWGPGLISQLARYTHEAVLEPKQTMDIGPATPPDSTIDGLLFDDFGSFILNGQQCGVLLCIGITKQEKQLCLDGHTERVLNSLRTQGIHPFTDLQRDDSIN